MNTLFCYLYRDASNYKKFKEVLISGILSEEDLEPLLYEGMFFIPSEVGLEDLQDELLSEDDHIWHEIDSISQTTESHSGALEAKKLIKAFKNAAAKDWNQYSVFSEERLHMNSGKPWSREELILAINLYCKTPFGKIHYRNPDIIALSATLGRTPGSVSYKLANFASLDPSLDRKGASNVSKLDREVWQDFFENWEGMAYQSEKLMAEKMGRLDQELAGIAGQKEGKDKEILIKARVNQGFFRKMILAAYDNTCCITGLGLSELLIASHIIPWSVDISNRLNPRNGLCLNALHDKAFDTGLISIGEDYKVLVSPRVKTTRKTNESLDLLLKYENRKITLPDRFIPDEQLLKRHRTSIFKS